jgi:hypothetical protein
MITQTTRTAILTNLTYSRIIPDTSDVTNIISL